MPNLQELQANSNNITERYQLNLAINSKEVLVIHKFPSNITYQRFQLIKKLAKKRV